MLRLSKYDIIRSQFQCPLTKTGNLYSAPLKNNVPVNSLELSPLKFSIFGSKFKTKDLASQTRAQQTSATYFRYSLMDLLQKMVHGAPHFVRCLKPNGQKAPNEFDRLAVSVQLAYAGVLEAVRIRQNGYSHRLSFTEFLKRYHCLGFGFDERVVISRDTCRLLLLRLKLDGWALGKTKVFLKYYHVEYLSRLYEAYMHKIVLVQSCVRRWLAKVKACRQAALLTQSALTLQKYTRGWLARKKASEMRSEEAMTISPTEMDPSESSQEKNKKRPAPQQPTLKVGDDSLSFEQEVVRAKTSISKDDILTQKYFRKWQDKQTIYQQVQRISADTAQQLMALSQQVHINNQEAHKQQRSSNIPVPINRLHGQVDQKALPKKRTAPKAPSEILANNHGNVSQESDGSRSRLAPSSAAFSNKSRGGKGQPDQRQRTPPLYLDEIEPNVVPNKPAALPTPAKRPAVQQINWSPPLQCSESQEPTVRFESPGGINGGENAKVGTGPEPAVHNFHRFLRKVQPPSASSSVCTVRNAQSGSREEDAGPYDFKKLLRKTNYAPTESLRRRKGISAPEPHQLTPPVPVAPPRIRPNSSPMSPSPPQRPISRPHPNYTNGHHQYILSQQFSPQIQIISPVCDL